MFVKRTKSTSVVVSRYLNPEKSYILRLLKEIESMCANTLFIRTRMNKDF